MKPKERPNAKLNQQESNFQHSDNNQLKSSKQTRKNLRVSWIKYVFIALLFSVGLSIFLYPPISDFINEQSQTSIVDSYKEAIKKLSEEEKNYSLEQARAYNRSLLGRQTALADPFTSNQEYEDAVVSFLNVGEVIGYIEIPRIHVTLPIYGETSEAVLQKGVGWLSGTSLPVGGESTHTVLTGHRGLPTSRLFTDIHKLAIGDEFFLRNHSGILAYQVFEVRIIEPHDIAALEIIAGEDRATLLTCHPFMINSHRLLVMGKRVEYTGQLEKEVFNKSLLETLSPTETRFTIAVFVALILICLFALLVRRSRKKQASKSLKQRSNKQQ